MKIESMTEEAAREWYRDHFDGDIPAGMTWYWITNAQMFPDRPYVWLISGDEGLCGIFGVKREAVNS